ncbi:hypothetical protein HPB49_008024 [Dermacentor silvarum]|uniref:Uncharacterized protein n=1 Tax=Dermacentor silvarum TaxID=543639 RepID=A0ACB8C8G9_DERSI|nr:hypothetical protein HPB49_008024 [Dermacentor silvarum]
MASLTCLAAYMGFKKLCHDEQPKSYYTHCCNHALDLALPEVPLKCDAMCEVLTIVKGASNAISESAKRKCMYVDIVLEPCQNAESRKVNRLITALPNTLGGEETEEQAADSTHPEASPTPEETKGSSGSQSVEAKSALSGKPTTEENTTGTKGAPSSSTSESTTKDGTKDSEDANSREAQPSTPSSCPEGERNKQQVAVTSKDQHEPAKGVDSASTGRDAPPDVQPPVSVTESVEECMDASRDGASSMAGKRAHERTVDSEQQRDDGGGGERATKTPGVRRSPFRPRPNIPDEPRRAVNPPP